MFIKKDTYGVGTGRLRKLRVLSAIIVGCCVLFINTAGGGADRGWPPPGRTALAAACTRT